MVLRRNPRCTAALFFLALAHPSASRGADLAYGVDVGIGESDNVKLVETDKTRQTIGVIDVDFTLQQQLRLFDVTAKGDFSYLDFLQGAYRDELIGRFDGLTHLSIVPDRLTWMLRDDFGQAQIDPFVPVTPGNLENVNYLSTGPELEFRPGTSGFVDLTAHYAQTRYQVSPYDNHRLVGSFAAGERASERSELSFNGTSERVLFDDTVVNRDFDRFALYGHYALLGARTELTANLGAIEARQNARAHSEPLAKLQLRRKVSAAATWSITAGRSITDSSATFSGLQNTAIGIIGNAPASQTSANYTVSYASADFDFVRNRTTLFWSGSWEKDAYIDVPRLNLTRESLELNVERRLTGSFKAQVSGRILRADYPGQNFVATDGQLGTRLTWRGGRALEVRLEYNHSARRIAGIGAGFGENRVFLTVGYRPKPMGETVVIPARLGAPAPGIDP
jgi:hypothetical protein